MNVTSYQPLKFIESRASLRFRNRSTHAAETEAAEWDHFVLGHVLGHHEQCSEYGRLREQFRYASERVIIRTANTIVGGVQLLVQHTPIGKHAVVKKGPLAKSDDGRAMQETVAALDDAARKRRYVSIRVDLFPEQRVAHAVLKNAGYFESNTWVDDGRTIVIPLTLTDDEILAQMTQKCRYNIRLAERRGVVVRRGSAGDLDDFYHLHTLTTSHQGFPPFPRNYYDVLWNMFGRSDRMQLFTAYYHGKPVASIINATVGTRVVYGWGGLHRGEAERKLMANYLLHFRAMQWSREHGCTHYDFNGVTTFKKKFGGIQTEWPATLRKFYGPLRKIRRIGIERAWAHPRLRRLVDSIAWRSGLRQRMPW